MQTNPEIKIDKSIPIPPTPGTAIKYPFAKMNVGDSIPVDDIASGRNAAYSFGNRNGLMFTCRGDKGKRSGRIWRLK